MAAGQWYCQAHDRVLSLNIRYPPTETDITLCICYRLSNLKMPSNRTTDTAQATTSAQSARTTLTTKMSYGNTQKKTIMPVGNVMKSATLAALYPFIFFPLISLSGNFTRPYIHRSYSTATRNFENTTVTNTTTVPTAIRASTARPACVTT